MEQLIVKLSILVVLVVGIMYMAMSFIPLFVLKDRKKDVDEDEDK
ncbi:MULTISPECIES: hypothetical protein [unclassified Thermoanaerobacterium]|nr:MULTISPECIES: hypothetical protein [unclassified Thermoanaerobacterium]